MRPLAEGPPVAEPLIAIEEEDEPCCCVVDDDADASACWNADIVYRVYSISMVQNERDRVSLDRIQRSGNRTEVKHAYL